MAELKVVSEMVYQHSEPPDVFQRFPLHTHDRSQCEVLRGQRARLKDLAPEIRVDRHRLPTEG